MSRQIAEETLSSPTGEIDEHHRIGEDHRAECQRKRRGDWSEYLDSAVEDDCIREGEANYGEGSVLEPKIVTELSKELFKKPKLTNSYSVGLNKFGESKSFRPTFSNRKTNKAIISQENKESVKSQPTAMAQQSKWSHYLIQEDDSDLFLGPGDSPPGAFETRAYDQRVEDDIHPDFI
ncbi:hypothetical protein GIB67_020454 [Kingdonia uniflora]|uniref:Uncharacterized protein n=1 Tax=Kingdonia uniflora TaxID=39325 RepID=A0A7J7LV02_9MAGN|nr:hypothetical protein GIB67_020454 [Kingdonia uniflora]